MATELERLIALQNKKQNAPNTELQRLLEKQGYEFDNNGDIVVDLIADTNNGKKNFGKITYDAYNAVKGNTLDSYKPKNDEEKKILDQYKQYTGMFNPHNVKVNYDNNKYGKGNIDLTDRPRYVNEDGTISTVASTSFESDGKHILVPTIVKDANGNAKKLTTDEAWKHYLQTGEHLGVFNTQKEADEYAQNLHIEQDTFYSNSVPLAIDVDGETKNFGNITINGYEAISNGKLDSYNPQNDEEKKTISEYTKFAEEYAKKQREPENFGQGLLHSLVYTLENLGAGAVDGAMEVGRYGGALFQTVLRPFTWGSWNQRLKDATEELLSAPTYGDMWKENLESRYRVPDWYRNSMGSASYNVGSLAPALVAEVATKGASPLLEQQAIANMAMTATKGSVATNIAKSLIKPKTSDFMFGMSAAGNAASEGYKATGDIGKSLRYGALNGLGEVATEKLFGGIGGTGIGADEAIDVGKALSKIKGVSKLASTKYGKKVLDIAFEGVEEVIMTDLEPWFQKMTINPDAKINHFYDSEFWKDRGESFAQGVLLSGLMNAGTYTINKTSNAIQKAKAIKVVNNATNGINALFENDADKLIPLKKNATIEEIQQRQNEIGVFAMAYADIMVDELVKNNPEKFKDVEKVSVGDKFKDTKTGYTITVVERDSAKTTVKIDTGVNTITKQFSNSQADKFATSEQLTEIETTPTETKTVVAENDAINNKIVDDYESEADELMNTDMSEETVAVETPTETVKAQPEMPSVKVGDVYEADGKTYTITGRENGRTTYTVTDGNGKTVTREVSNVTADINFTKEDAYTKVKDGTVPKAETVVATPTEAENQAVTEETTTNGETVQKDAVELADGEILSLKRTKNIYSLFKGAKNIVVGKDVISDGFVAIPLTDKNLEGVKKVSKDAIIQNNSNFSLDKLYSNDNDVIIQGNPKITPVTGGQGYVFKIGNEFYVCNQKYIDTFNNGKNVIKANKNPLKPWVVHDANGNFVGLFLGAKKPTALNNNTFEGLQSASDVLESDKQKKAEKANIGLNQNEIRLFKKAMKCMYGVIDSQTYITNGYVILAVNESEKNAIVNEYETYNSNSSQRATEIDLNKYWDKYLLWSEFGAVSDIKVVDAEQNIVACVVNDIGFTFNKDFVNLIKKRGNTLKILSNGTFAETLLATYNENGDCVGVALPVRNDKESIDGLKMFTGNGLPDVDVKEQVKKTENKIKETDVKTNGEVLQNQQKDDTIEEKETSGEVTDNTPSKSKGTKQIADYVAKKLANGEKISALELSKIATEAFGGTMSNNVFTVKDAYDAMELGVNQHILSMEDISSEKMLELLELLPTQTKRTEDVDKFQQFSTPPSIAYLANYTANVNENDVMLEPSAGIGGIAVFAKKDGAKVYVNELDSRRLEVLKNMPFDGFYNEDAEQLNNPCHQSFFL